MFEITRPTKKFIDKIIFNPKDPLWGSINFFQNQIENLMLTAHTKEFKTNYMNKMRISGAISSLSNIRDLQILSKYN